ncbi:transglycosylase domain-containing protein [Lactococcus carnosus]|uniref:transglycosylase domain-containing protein n=1 Tax=Pseudolactococcus carnosus TaxID=2749961 RepID=UPI000811FC7F|nr:PBP1A family penicillin-binding protein [Lactococcus carnosus]SCA91082.1 putative Multimodular transpeptidase-transglycosylase (Membrane carboxypeptidase (penicillin-binding protein) / GT51, similar to LACPI-0241 from L. piscium MKFS47 (Murein polymerase) [Lactococcus piscium]MCJ1970008.1 PBP1A family penicillin-binding protein [Lactococcus carnosus]MCJ1972775.1 PBP1A family penicillin-binding protein [Lactococcus carnosus]MCJ1975208.1 PBP1A family penicillin-binding protein [Lactococcus car
MTENEQKRASLSRSQKNSDPELEPKVKSKKRQLIPAPIKRFWKKYNLTKIVIAIVLFVVLATASYLLFLAKTADVKTLKQSMEARTEIIDKDGKSAGTMYGQKGTTVKFEDISDNIKNAVVATEDRTFYKNSGINIKRTILAVMTLGKFGGGSTITQQLAKNAYLTQKQTIDRKAKELFLALEINKKYEKNDILTMYLNNSYFGNGIWGIQDASLKYYGKSAKDISVEQAATLVGILKWPEAYNPLYKEGKFAKDRRDTVLQNMVNTKFITQDVATSGMQVGITSNLADAYVGKDDDYNYPSYFDAVIQEAISKYGLSEQDILNNGYKIYTGLDQSMQTGMQTTYASTTQFPVASDGVSAQSASVALDPKSGEVEALIGRVPTAEHNSFRGFNFATQSGRSPGSTIKPLIVYAPAIEAGWSINKTVRDQATDYNGWAPLNADRRWHGDMPLYQALANSYNIPAINTFKSVGIQTGIAKGKQFGLDLTSKNDNLTTALGAGVETNPWQMAQAYATFANDGIMNDAHLIKKITNASGQTIATAKVKSKRVIDSKTAQKMTSMMLGTYTNGTGIYAAPYGYTLAGKTGTNEDIDQWVIGYTPDVVMTLWLGYENPQSPLHRLDDTSAGTASTVFRTMSSAILPATNKTQFTEENAYSLAGLDPVTSPSKDQATTDVVNEAKDKTKEITDKAKDFTDKTSEKVKEVGGSIWDRVKSLFD